MATSVGPSTAFSIYCRLSWAVPHYRNGLWLVCDVCMSTLFIIVHTSIDLLAVMPTLQISTMGGLSFAHESNHWSFMKQRMIMHYGLARDCPKFPGMLFLGSLFSECTIHVTILKREGCRDEAKALLEEGKQVGEPTDELDDTNPLVPRVPVSRRLPGEWSAAIKRMMALRFDLVLIHSHLEPWLLHQCRMVIDGPHFFVSSRIIKLYNNAGARIVLVIKTKYILFCGPKSNQVVRLLCVI